MVEDLHEKVQLEKRLTLVFARCDIQGLANIIYEANRFKGFWPKYHEAGQRTVDTEAYTTEGVLVTIPQSPRNIGEQLMLVVTELSEALETFRKNGFDGPSNVLPAIPHFTEEIADTIIRLLDLAGGFALPLVEALEAKLLFNMNRPPKHGKAF